MRKLSFIAALLFLGLTACNNAGQNNDNASSDSMQMEGMDHSQMASADAGALPPVPADAKVFFKNLEDGQTVSSPFKVEMGVDGMTVEPSGEIKEGYGHHHILIDAGDSMAAGTVVPTDSAHLHFGKGQTETELTLPPGKHTLTLQFADGIHRSYGSQLAASITVTVE